MKRIAIQGQVASYHNIAAQTFFGDDIDLVNCETFIDVFRALSKKQAEYAVVALENSLYGSINKVYDLMLKHRFWISGEVYLRIEHCLLGLPGSKISEIKEVHSQLEALAQCEEYLDNILPAAKRLEHHDTAASARDIKLWNDPLKAAIASEQAGKLHGLEVLAKGIETHKENYTRFVILQHDKNPAVSANKTSLILKTPADTKPGALYHALGVFATRNINLSLLHSRPVIGKAWHYIFYIDIDNGLQQEELKAAIDELKSQGCEVIILGSYKAGRG